MIRQKRKYSITPNFLSTRTITSVEILNFLKILYQISKYMMYRKLGATDLNVSMIGLGTWQFCGEWGHKFSESEVGQILNFAESAGINLIDTAECYGDHLSEHLVGSFL